MTFDEYVAARLPELLRFAVMLTGDPYLADGPCALRAGVHWWKL